MACLQTLTGCAGERVNATLSTLVRTVNHLTSTTSEMTDETRLFIAISLGQIQVALGRLTNVTNNTMAKELKNWLTQVEKALANLNQKYNGGPQKVNGKRRWTIDFPPKMTKLSSVYKVAGPQSLKSNVFNNCFDQMTGQNKYKRKGPCSVSIPCWNVMTEPSSEMSYLTKQLQYLIFGENFNCDRVMVELGPTTPNRGSYVQIVEAVCSTILSKIDENNKWEDTLYENVIFCGMYGFKDFFASGFKRADYFHSLLNKDGCVTDAVQDPSGTNTIMAMMGVDAGNCFVDRTAITVAYLIQFLKFLIEDPTYILGTKKISI